MKKLFDDISNDTATLITKSYSTSFSIAVKLLHSSIRQDIYNVYGFVRVADEIVDSFKSYPQEELLNRFEAELWHAIKHQISTNPVIHAFQSTINKHSISHDLIRAFLKSMRADLTKKVYSTQEEIDEYVYGSADVVGLMCLKIFVKGNQSQYDKLEASATRLGSAFQKVNFLRDLRQDSEELNRIYFPNVDPNNFTEADKAAIISEIKDDFKAAKLGIDQLPSEAKLGVYVAYKYYLNLLQKMTRTPASILKGNRIRVSNPKKMYLLAQSYMKFKFNLTQNR